MVGGERRLELGLVDREERRRRDLGAGAAALAGAPVLVARGRLKLGEALEPSACAKRTTVELEVFARRASSSAVWKAASSRWSTMYCPTSFCERENSSKRWRISSERVSAVVPVRVTGLVFAEGACSSSRKRLVAANRWVSPS